MRECPDTQANLEEEGVPFDIVLCRDETSEKEPRWESIEDGTASEELPPLEILMYVGDNIHDFPDHDQDVRFAGEVALQDFGHRFIVIPNPMYGSWTGNPQD